ncbi:NB-ARC domain-containing protein [Anabaenopsis tanganyikae CS-531]|uniref:NB-ARC domain-containing protein n=2 Tax=Anabaenopsis TaxID=110103 RepID=A0ABT5ALS4_9CYAN|nr:MULTISPECIES: NB-ARC domain-containing protein [Anabaenopsis]MDB9538246.1 NB-ARC domain-containing protein [Anabaenopsis arnoldii]MDH6090299.1 NB-ARC domain-containing protein [Anabaenopsis arnoldii]MDH6106358.1 NB-ARC domain-containing protein [Anabaenopsis tanganyikae CS-531]
MTVNEVVKFVDQIVFDKTGKHLDDIQTAVIAGTWERQTYDDIAQKHNVTKNHIGDVGSELWQLLSKALGEDIKKNNFRSTLERVYIKSSENSNIYNINGSNNYFYHPQTLTHPNRQNQEPNTNNQPKLSYHDLTLAPQIIKFHNRETELQTLTQWILNQNTRLTSILGTSGIGKTTLVKRFIDLNIDKFEIIIWKSLKYPKSLNLLIDDLLQVCKQEPEKNLDDKIKQLFNILTNNKCLIILDDIQNLFIPGKLAGKYQPEYQDYQTLFKLVTETQHQSNIILISQEQCPEMESLDPELYPIKSLELSGLYHPDILQNTGLKNQDIWLNLIKLYAGNLMLLKSITVLIAKNYDGEVAEFLAENTLHITQQMQSYFQETFNRLSPIEQQIVLQLSKFEKPISREELRQSLIQKSLTQNLNLSSVDFNNGLQSLQQRYLVRKQKEDKVMFSLSSVFREYVRNLN